MQKYFLSHDMIIFKYKKMFQLFSIEFTGFFRIFRTPRDIDKTGFCIYETDFGRFCRNAKTRAGKDVFVERIKG